MGERAGPGVLVCGLRNRVSVERRWPFPSALAAVALALASNATGQSRKLNGSMFRAYRGEVEHVEITPDGERVVYEAYSEAGRSGFFSVSTKGGHPSRIDAALPGHFVHKGISPDSRFFVYASGGLHRVPLDGRRPASRLAPQAELFGFTTDGSGIVFSTDEGLFHVPLHGSDEPVMLTELVAGRSISGFEVGGAGRGAAERVCFLADAETAGVTELFSVSIDASAPPVKLNGPFASFSDAWFVAIAPGGERVVFLADPEVDGHHVLQSARIDGSGAPVVLATARVRNSDFVRISADGRWVVFLAEPGIQNVFELFAVPTDGSAPAVRLNAVLPAGGSVASFDVAPGSDRVVYLADQDENDVSELFAVAIDGSSPPVEIDHELEPGEDVRSFVVRGQRVVYRAELDPRTSASLHSVPVAGDEAPVELSGGVSVNSFLVSPDGARVAFLGPESQGIGRGLFSVPVGGGDPVLLDADGRWPVGITADGERVLYEADRDIPGVLELFSVSIRGGRNPVPLNHPMAALEVADVNSVRVSPDGERCLFVVRADTCDCDDSGSFELHGAGIDPLSPSAWIADDIGLFEFTSDGAWTVFQERLNDGEDFGRLFSARVGGVLEPLELEAAAGRFFALLPDSRTVVFTKSGPMAGVHRRPIDGSSPASPLALGAVERLALSPDGTRVVYTKRDGLAHELFSVLADGTGAPVQLNDVTAPRGYPWYPFGITPDGARVFYTTDQLVDGVFELFSVPIDGSAGPTKLSGTLVPGGDVELNSSSVVSPDSARLVYRADALVDGVQDLFSVPVDGSGAPVRLNATLPALGWIREFALLSDGSRVVYRAEQAADEVYELFSVPIDASTPPVRLNAPLVAGGDVSAFGGTSKSAFVLSPDGSRVVYLADQRADGVFELFSAWSDGRGTPKLLGGRSIAEGDVRDSFQITADGKHVIYAADHDRDEVVELYGAPIGGGKASRLNARFVAGGGIDVFVPPRITPDGKWLLYAADQDTDTVNELYRVPLSLPHSGAGGPPGPPKARLAR